MKIVACDPQPSVEASAPARVGLLGNPSDGYGGRVIAMTVPAFEATVQLRPASAWSVADRPVDLDELEAFLVGSNAGAKLLGAAIAVLTRSRPELIAEPASLTFTTTIPRQVGLSGSSAIIIAALRTLAARGDTQWQPVDLARRALEAETDVLGWAAGPQDRVVQAYGGLLDMDFASPWNAGAYSSLDAAHLPPLFMAWDRTTGAPSDAEHSRVRERWLAGDRQVIDVMASFAELAAAGRAALDADRASTEWPHLLDSAFELRRRIWHITDRDNALVRAGRDGGAGVAFAGSGGAVVGAVAERGDLVAIESRYAAVDAGFMVLA